MSDMLAQCGLVAEYFGRVGKAPLGLSVYVDNLAQKTDKVARSLRERQIRLVRGVSLEGAQAQIDALLP